MDEIRALLNDCNTATVMAERIGRTRGMTILKERVAELRPISLEPDPFQRTDYRPGERRDVSRTCRRSRPAGSPGRPRKSDCGSLPTHGGRDLCGNPCLIYGRPAKCPDGVLILARGADADRAA
jgi:hypothetical protein